MNRFLAFVLIVAQSCVCFAVNPSFQSFTTTQFGTNNSQISVKSAALLTNAVSLGTQSQGGTVDFAATTLTAAAGHITPSWTTTAVQRYVLDADTVLDAPTGTSTNKQIQLDLYTDGTHWLTFASSYSLPETTNAPLAGVGGKVSMFIERAESPTGGLTNYVSWTPSLVGPADLTPTAYLWTNNAGIIQGSLTYMSLGEYGTPPFILMRPGLLEMRVPDATNGVNGLQLWVDNNYWAFYGFNASGVGNFLVFDPFNNDGLPAPYYFSTPNPVSSGNLLGVDNNGTNKVRVTWDGAITLSGLTNRITDTGTALAYNGTPISANGSSPTYNTTIITNLTIEQNITVKGNSTLNVVTANTGTFSNGVTFASGLNITSGNLTNAGSYQGTINGDTAGTVLKQTKYLIFQTPSYGDGVGAVPQTNNYTVTGFCHYTFSGSAATNANYTRYELAVPEDLDTSGTIKIARYKFSTSGTSTSQINWHIAFGQSAVSAARTPTMGTHILFNVTPSSVSANDIFEASAVTLTGWASALTVGNWWVIEVARDGSDSNNDSMTDAVLVLSYTAKSQ